MSGDKPAAETLARLRAREVGERELATLFTEARTARAFLPEPVPRDRCDRRGGSALSRASRAAVADR